MIRHGNRGVAWWLSVCLSLHLIQFRFTGEGRQLIDDDVMGRLYRYLVLLPDDKCLDFAVNKVASAILRCAGLQNLPLAKLHSAFTYRPFRLGTLPDPDRRATG